MSVSPRMTWCRSRPSAPHVGQKPSTCRGEASMTVTSPSATLAPVMNTPSSRVRQMTSATGQPAGAQEVDSTVGPWVEDGRFEHLHLHPRPAHDPPQLAVSDDALRTLNPEEPGNGRLQGWGKVRALSRYLHRRSPRRPLTSIYCSVSGLFRVTPLALC